MEKLTELRSMVLDSFIIFAYVYENFGNDCFLKTTFYIQISHSLASPVDRDTIEHL